MLSKSCTLLKLTAQVRKTQTAGCGREDAASVTCDHQGEVHGQTQFTRLMFSLQEIFGFLSIIVKPFESN